MIKEKIYQNIRERIVSGEFAPGEHIVEATLSEEFNCSRAPVREAIHQMEREGYLTSSPFKGTRVKKYSKIEIKDYWALKDVLDATAVEWAVRFLTDDDIGYLKNLNHSMKRLSKNNNDFVRIWNEKNSELHRFFREKCGNEKMSWLIGEIHIRITRYRFTLWLSKDLDVFQKDHDRLIEAMAKRDAKKARRAMEIHSRNIQKELATYLG